MSFRAARPSPLYIGGDRWDSEKRRTGIPENAVDNTPIDAIIRDASRLECLNSFDLGYTMENEGGILGDNRFNSNYNSLYNCTAEITTPMSRLLGPRPVLHSRMQNRGYAPAGDIFETYVDDEMEVDDKDDASAPVVPTWDKTRPFLTGQHLWLDQEKDKKEARGLEKISEHSPSMQESIIIDDLLYGFMGLGGQYLRFEFEENSLGKREVSCCLSVELDPSLQAKVERVLSVCEDVVVLQRFVETRISFDTGMVCHAVAAGIRQVLDDWMLMVTQLEGLLNTGRLTMQSLWYYIQAPMLVMQTLAGIARRAASERLQGSGLLNLIYKTLGEYAGDRSAQVLLQKLLVAGCVPYFEILERWLCEGVLADPYHEFMISENADVSKTSTTERLESRYWHERYTVYSGDNPELGVPLFLMEHQEIILKTGKYLNAIRECDIHVQRPLDEDEHVTYDSSGGYVVLIHKAHKESSRAFLKLFMQDLRLIPWLRGIKHFFLHDRGDVLGHLMDIADEEFRKTPSQISHTRLQSLLELAVRTSSVPSHTNSEPLGFDFNPLSLVEMAKGVFSNRNLGTTSFRSSMRKSISDDDGGRLNHRSADVTGFDVFTMSYRVDWPLTLIAPVRQMLRYQLLFKHLFSLKRVERELGKAWHVLQMSKRIFHRNVDGVLQRTCLLCHDFMHTFQMYIRFLTVEILEPEWITLEAEVAKAKDVDKVMETHKQFVSRVLRHSLLRKMKVVALLDQLERDALKFSALVIESIKIEDFIEEQPQRRGDSIARRRRQRESENQAIADAVSSTEFQLGIREMESAFTEKVEELLVQMRAVYEASANNKEDDSDSSGYTREDLDRLLNLIERLNLKG
ncbi:hypothetical protein BSKO_02246 [Bryopsis sp. KO-2023]|nr:hypothetical protein BSKO_02246 [Bryopsis sp. KO-2023]